ncbi:MAG TPA: FtsW/RodA/SpoVE family cell cycle protein, partial [Gaiella sp.]
MSARNRELATLLLAGLVASTAFASAWISGLATVDYGWLPWAAVLGGIFLVAHAVTRWTVPDADPTLLPLVALISAIGLVFVYRIEPQDGRRQLVWIAVGVAAFALVLVWLRYDYRVLERYKYVFGISAIVLLMLPSVPGLGQRVNGVKLWVDIGPLRFQPGEIAKIFLVIFLAGYLRDKREALARGRLKDFGPLLAIWGAAMLVLVQTSDLGSALLNFGIFLAGYLRDKREALARGRLKDFGPLLAIWGAAMLVLVQTSDLGSALLNFGIFLAMVYVATG